MNIAIFAYSRTGCKTARRICMALPEAETLCYAVPRLAEPGFLPLEKAVYGAAFSEMDALIFVGAVGIAVREIAPYVRDKRTDPAVLGLDERANFVIPLLSGHIGGANALARRLAAALGATAVVTTATDVNGLFAVDVFAASNRLAVAGHDGIARVSAGLLRAGYLTMSVAGECEGEIPPEVRLVPYPPKEPVDVLVAPQCEAGERCSLWLIPSCLLLGVGCRRGKS